MSIEQTIQNLTAAVEALTAAIQGGSVPVKTQPEKTAEVLAAEVASAKGTKKNAKGAATAQSGATPQSEAETAAPEKGETSSDGPTLEQLAEEFRALLGTKRDAALALLDKYGAKKLTLLDPVQYADFLADVKGA